MIFNIKYSIKKSHLTYREISKEEFNSEVQFIYNIKKDRYKKNGKYFELKNSTACLIYLIGNGVVGLSAINHENYKKVYNRINTLETLVFKETFMNGFNPITNEKYPIPFTLEMVKNNQGLSTNSSIIYEKDFINYCRDYIIEN